MPSTLNPKFLRAADGRIHDLSCGDEECWIASVTDTIGKLQSLGVGGSIWSYLPGQGRSVDDVGTLYATDVAARVRTIAGHLPTGRFFRAGYGHYLVELAPANRAPYLLLDGNVEIQNALTGRLGPERVCWVNHVARKEVISLDLTTGTKRTIKAPFVVGRLAVAAGWTIYGPAGGRQLLGDDGTTSGIDCRRHPVAGEAEGSLIAFEVGGQCWIGTGLTLDQPYAVIGPAGSPDVSAFAVADISRMDAAEDGPDLLVVVDPSTHNNLTLFRTASDAPRAPLSATIPPPIPPDPEVPVAVPNLYQLLLDIGKQTGLMWQESGKWKGYCVDPSLTPEQREDYCAQLIEHFVMDAHKLSGVQPGKPTSWGHLDKRGSGSNQVRGHSTDYAGYMDGSTFRELDLIYSAGAVDSRLQWDNSPDPSKWPYMAPFPPPPLPTTPTEPQPPKPTEPEVPTVPEPIGPFAPYYEIRHDVIVNAEHGWEAWMRKYFEHGGPVAPQSEHLYHAQAFDAWRRSMQAQITALGQNSGGGWNLPGDDAGWFAMADKAGAAMHRELNFRP